MTEMRFQEDDSAGYARYEMPNRSKRARVAQPRESVMRTLRNLFWFVSALPIMALAVPAFTAEPANPNAWVGTWEGTWPNLRHVLFTVRRVENGKAEVIYEWGTSPLDTRPDKGSRNWTLEFTDEKTLIKSEGETPLSFTISPDGREIKLKDIKGLHSVILKKK